MNRRYLVNLVLASSLLLGAHALLCWWIDPYGIYRKPTALSTDAADLFHHLRLTKAYQIEYIKPSVLILGSSRAASLNPTIIADGLNAYNVALPGLTPFEMRSYLRHAIMVGVPKRLVIALDYEAFLSDERFRPGFSEHRMARYPTDTIGIGPFLRHAPDYWPTLFSLAASRKAVTSLVSGTESGVLVHPNGSWENRRAAGFRLLGRSGFRFVLRQYFDQLSSQQPKYDLTELSDIINTCHQLGIDTRLYISPVHHSMALVHQRTSHYRSRQRWQQDVISLLDEYATDHNTEPFQLWGFEDNETGSEDIPPAGQSAHWYQDGLHITATFGRIILEELTSKTKPDLGRRLTSRTISQYQESVDRRLENYKHNHPDEIAWLTEITRSR